MIKNFTPRLYQETIFHTAVQKNTLVVLPTGMGKTNIFLMLAAHRLQLYPSSKILFIGPTRPLIDQYLQVFQNHFDMPEKKFAVFTGMVTPEKRAELWKQATVIFSTPQGLENDIISQRIDLKEVSLLGFDEAHRAVGDYSYVFVAKCYHKTSSQARIIGMTASPGSDMDEIQEVCKNLFIEAIEVRSDQDPDVSPYVQETEINYLKVALPPPFIAIQQHLKHFLKQRLQKLKDIGVLKRAAVDYVSKTDLLQLQGEIRGKIAAGEKDFLLWNSISILAEIMKVSHALELLETQGIVSLHAYMERIQKEAATTKVKAVKQVAADPDFRLALIKTAELLKHRIEHPKLIELQRLVENAIKENPSVKIMVFNQYRENALDIKKTLNNLPGVSAQIFVGQQKKGETGLSQKEQKALIEQFSAGIFNVLVATSIGEEGLDIPQVDLVIFFEPIPSAIRSIQRRGRTGRHAKGNIIILVTQDTRDEAYRWTAHHKEQRMFRNLEKLRKTIHVDFIQNQHQEKMSQSVPQQSQLKEKPVKIFVDHREKTSRLVKELIDLGTDIQLATLDAGDYIVSSRAGIEYKTKEDFVNSIIDGRLLEQIKSMKHNFERPLLILEGDEDLYSIRNIHPHAIRGMLATITVSYGIPMLFTKDSKETASLIYLIAKREQQEQPASFTPHAEKRILSLKEQQEYVVSSLPLIGPIIAKDLLKKFGTVKKIFNAKDEQLERTENIGPEKAKKIREVIDKEYEE